MALVLSSILLPTACGDESNSLSGSIKSFPGLELSFDNVFIRKTGESLTINYVKKVQTYTSDVVKLSVSLTAGGSGQIETGVDYNIPRYGQLVKRSAYKIDKSGTVVANTADFPEIDSGEIRFFKLSDQENATISGKFSIIFKKDTSQGIEAGQTMKGRFSQPLQFN